MISNRLVKGLRKRLEDYFPLRSYAVPEVVDEGQRASDSILALLRDDRPAMIARFGSVELNSLAEHYYLKSLFNPIKYIFGKSPVLQFSPTTFHETYNNAGIFPSSTETLHRFGELMLKDITEIDILGSWQPQESLFLNRINTKIVRIRDLEPYYHRNPWSQVLTGLKVLVVHPFTESIKAQYKRREKLFEQPFILPEFVLTTYRPVQSIAGNESGFTDWFEALDHMKAEITELDFDIAIIGCGAYGLPLAAHIKRMGRKSVHLGGATQILFGIKGKRWVEHPIISKFFNEYWINPSANERPKGFGKVEHGCYW